jgi:hypothetical protein
MSKRNFYLGFDRSFDVIFRAIQSTLVNSSSKNLGHHINQIALIDSAKYAYENFSEAMVFSKREELWDYCTNKSFVFNHTKAEKITIAEFGVWNGYSLNFWAKKYPKADVFGFDSFMGLEENWTGVQGHFEGTFDTLGKLPECENNVKLIVGWFEESLPIFLSNFGNRQIHLLHMDADTYKPTAFVLNSLVKSLSKGTLIVFDEYFGYPNFRSHEFKAWQEFVKANGIKYRYIGYTEVQVAVEII